MRRHPFHEVQQQNPFRRPTWRWDRANDLVGSGRYFSRRRDDTATGIAVGYLRDLARCRSERRLERVADRYRHLHSARRLWEHAGGERLEIETRILARESDVAIAYAMDLPPSTVQAYRDIFFHMDDRIEATQYILFQVIRLHPGTPPPARLLMQASAYMRGPEVIEPWLRYLTGETGADDLTTTAGRLQAQIELFVTVCTLPETVETSQKLAELTPMLAEIDKNSSKAVSARNALSETTAGILAEMDLPSAVIPPFSYRPAEKGRPVKRPAMPEWQLRRAA